MLQKTKKHVVLYRKKTSMLQHSYKIAAFLISGKVL